MKKKIKQMIIKWAVKQIKTIPVTVTYETLSRYGICDIMTDPETGEKSYYFD